MKIIHRSISYRSRFNVQLTKDKNQIGDTSQRKIMEPIIIDIGTHSTKLGLANCRKNQPDYIINSEDASKSSESVDLSDLLQNDFEAIARNAMNSTLQVSSEDHPLMIVEKPGLDGPVRESVVEQAFEGLNVPAFHLASEPLMALYSIGLSSGIVLLSGHFSSFVSTVHEGRRPPYGLISMGFGGNDLTCFTRTLLCDELKRDIGLSEAEDVKREYACLQSHHASSSHQERADDGLQSVGLKVAEMLISPGNGFLGFPDAISRSVYQTDEEDEYEPVYFRNIMLCGGNTMIPGIKERLESEIRLPDYLDCGVRVVETPFRQYAGWVGGSVAASLPTFSSYWITRLDYSEYGRNILHRKCLSY